MLWSVLETLWEGVKKSHCSSTYRATDVILFLTYRCTSRCKTCNLWRRPAKKEDELSWDEWEPILRKLHRRQINSIELFGGDALLRKDVLFRMVEFCTQHGIRTFFPTNSSSLTEEAAQSLVKAGLGVVYFSLDETTEIGGQVRGVKRHADKVGEAIEMVKRARGEARTPRIVCITTVSNMNFRYLDEFIRYGRDLGVEEHELRGVSEFTQDVVDRSGVEGVIPEPYFMTTEGQSHRFTAAEAEELLGNLRLLWRNRKEYAPTVVSMTNVEGLHVGNLTELKYPRQACLFCTTQMVISPYGEVLPCPYYSNYRLGNLREQDVEDTWGSPAHRRFCAQQQRGQIPLCEYCSIKFYHKPFSACLADVLRRSKQKLFGL